MASSAPRWGYHQLDPRWARRLVGLADLPPGATVVDVGAGTGVICTPLLEAGARVIAVESHRARASQLRRRFGDRLIVVQVDAADLRLPRRPFHVVANPPFGIGVALLKRLLAPGSRLSSAHLVLPAHQVRRWAERRAPGARRWEQSFDIGIGPRVDRRSFRPAPSRDARVLVIGRRGQGQAGAPAR
ncbi:MAG: rRNA adenine N-6-methyltransferase family protein [Acidimicrobiales bacterium]